MDGASSVETAPRTCPVVDFDLFAPATRARVRRRRCRSVRDTGCPVAWTEHNGGHWIISTYDAGGRGVPRLGAVLLGADPPGAERDRLQQQQAPAVPPGGERPAPVVRLPPRAGGDPLAAGIGATAGAGPLLDQALPRPGRRAGRVRLRPRPDLPGARGGHAGMARVPPRGMADVLGRLPRRLRVPGRARRNTGRPPRRTGRC